MSIHEAIAFGRSKIGVWHYCTPSGSRFGQTNTCADCSGFVSRCLWEGGMPPGAFPQGSASMAAWAERNPAQRLSIAQARATFGAVVVWGGTSGIGARGHVEFSLGNGQTLGSAGSTNGPGIHAFDRLAWSHAMKAPISYAGSTPAPPPALTQAQIDAIVKALEEMDVEHGMAVDVVMNPNNPTQGYMLDRWGGVHPLGGAKPAGSTAYWSGLDVARRLIITDWAKPAGYVMDLNGPLHPFGGNPNVVTPNWKSGHLVAFTET